MLFFIFLHIPALSRNAIRKSFKAPKLSLYYFLNIQMIIFSWTVGFWFTYLIYPAKIILNGISWLCKCLRGWSPMLSHLGQIFHSSPPSPSRLPFLPWGSHPSFKAIIPALRLKLSAFSFQLKDSSPRDNALELWRFQPWPLDLNFRLKSQPWGLNPQGSNPSPA